MKKKNLSLPEIKKKLEFHSKEIGKHRDALRAMLDDIEFVLEPTEEAMESIQSAIDRISEVM